MATILLVPVGGYLGFAYWNKHHRGRNKKIQWNLTEEELDQLLLQEPPSFVEFLDDFFFRRDAAFAETPRDSLDAAHAMIAELGSIVGADPSVTFNNNKSNSKHEIKERCYSIDELTVSASESSDSSISSHCSCDHSQDVCHQHSASSLQSSSSYCIDNSPILLVHGLEYEPPDENLDGNLVPQNNQEGGKNKQTNQSTGKRVQWWDKIRRGKQRN